MSNDSRKPTTILKASSAKSTVSNSSFIERSHHVFSSIDELSKLNPESTLFQESRSQASKLKDRPISGSKNKRAETEVFRNRESIFKLSEREESGWPSTNKKRSAERKWESGRDQDSDFGSNLDGRDFKRPVKRQKLPDYVKNPTKYTKYDLSDTPSVNDRSNTQTALDFLKKLDERKKLESNVGEEEAMDKNVILFKRPKSNSQNNAKPSCSNFEVKGSCAISKRILPEAVVGRSSSFRNSKSNKLKNYEQNMFDVPQETKKKIKQRDVARTKLSHLMLDDVEC